MGAHACPVLSSTQIFRRMVAKTDDDLVGFTVWIEAMESERMHVQETRAQVKSTWQTVQSDPEEVKQWEMG